MPTLVAAGLSRAEYDQQVRRTAKGKATATRAKTAKSGGSNARTLAWIARLPGHDKRAAHGDTCQHRLNELAHHPNVEIALHVLLVLDILCVAVAMQLQMYYLESKIHDLEEALEEEGDDHHRRWRRGLSESAHDDGHDGSGGSGHGHEYGDHSLEHTEHNVVMVSVAILSVFLAHSLLLILANGRAFLSHPLAVLDLVVVLVSLVFELADRDGMVVGMIIFVRAFNFVRIGHGIFELEHNGEEGGGEEQDLKRKLSSDL